MQAAVAALTAKATRLGCPENDRAGGRDDGSLAWKALYASTATKASGLTLTPRRLEMVVSMR